jgi:hypothetical protein
LACGVLTGIRSMGVLIVCCICLFFIVTLVIARKNRKRMVREGYLFGLFIGAFFVSLYISWPYLWEHPINNFIEAFKSFSKFQFPVGMLFLGEMIKSTELNWNYAIIWILISNPVVYILLGIFASVFLLIKLIKKPMLFLKDDEHRNQLLYLLCFFVPLLAIIILKSAIYDGWRHLYFIYPAFVLIMVYGLNYLLQTRFKYIYLAIVFCGLASVASFMISNHPFQQVFFSEGIPKNDGQLRKTFDMDYWGTSYKQGLEYILKNDNSEKIRIMTANSIGETNSLILKAPLRERIIYVNDISEAEYFITVYRWHPDNYEDYFGKEFYNFRVQNNTISTVFKLK